MCLDRRTGLGFRAFGFAGFDEIVFHEGLDIEAIAVTSGQVIGADLRRITVGQCVHEMLLVSEHLLALHRFKELGIGLVGGKIGPSLGICVAPCRGRLA
ncbi:hypothetical protein D3C84_1100610 [compost metagenome]